MKFFSFFINFLRHASVYSSICLFMATGSSYGFIFQLDQWNNGIQSVYCLSDTQISTAYSQIQLNELSQFAGARDARIIVEDMFDYTGENTRIKNYLHEWQNSVKGKDFLLGSMDYLHTQGILKEKINNVEYRQAASAALDGNVSLSAGEVMRPAYNEYHKGWKYRDGKVFDQYYKSTLQDYKQLILKPCRALFFYMYWRASKPLAQVLSKANYYKSLDSVVSLFDNGMNQVSSDKKLNYIIKKHGVPLVKVRLVRAIAQACEKDIIVCAESGHISEVNTVLSDAGYQCVQSKSGTVRIGPKNSNAPRALKLHQILKQSDNIINTKVSIHKSEQMNVCSVSKIREDKQKRDAIQDMNRYIFSVVILLISFFVSLLS